jgi:hypothetical protein
MSDGVRLLENVQYPSRLQEITPGMQSSQRHEEVAQSPAQERYAVLQAEALRRASVGSSGGGGAVARASRPARAR